MEKYLSQGEFIVSNRLATKYQEITNNFVILLSRKMFGPMSGNQIKFNLSRLEAFDSEITSNQENLYIPFKYSGNCPLSDHLDMLFNGLLREVTNSSTQIPKSLFFASQEASTVFNLVKLLDNKDMQITDWLTFNFVEINRDTKTAIKHSDGLVPKLVKEDTALGVIDRVMEFASIPFEFTEENLNHFNILNKNHLYFSISNDVPFEKKKFHDFFLEFQRQYRKYSNSIQEPSLCSNLTEARLRHYLCDYHFANFGFDPKRKDLDTLIEDYSYKNIRNKRGE